MAGSNPGEQPEKSYREQVAEALASGGEIPDFPEANSMEELAISHNELYRGYSKVGFSEAQALYLTAVMITGQPGPPPKM